MEGPIEVFDRRPPALLRSFPAALSIAPSIKVPTSRRSTLDRVKETSLATPGSQVCEIVLNNLITEAAAHATSGGLVGEVARHRTHRSVPGRDSILPRISGHLRIYRAPRWGHDRVSRPFPAEMRVLNGAHDGSKP